MGRFWLRIFTTSVFLFLPLISYGLSTQTFIVRVQNDLKPSIFSNVESWYSATLRTLTSYPLDPLDHKSKNSNRGKETDFLHVYKTVFHGFSARLSAEQAQELSTHPQVLGVIPDRVRHIHTTRSPLFLGLTGTNPTGLITESDSGSNVIIGLLDTGISPERRSFNDVGLGPVPARWKGVCSEGNKFTKTSCNKKVIGARYFSAGYDASVRVTNSSDVLSARDSDGHGTHTASTAAGREVANASLFGFATGVAVGIAPKARIAVYKVCWKRGCLDSDILAGFDKAVEDGVDVVSISVGGDGSNPYNFDPIAIGSFGAMERGIFVSASAGNSGPDDMSVTNVAPWMTTVGASTIDRKFPVDLVLGDGTVITGSSVYDGKPLDGKTFFPIIYALNAVKANGSTSPFPTLCMPGSLDEKLTRGKIVVCDRGDISRVAKGLAVREAGGVGVVVANVPPLGEGLNVDPYLIPGLMITETAGNKVRDYISSSSSKDPRAKIVPHGTRLGVGPAPVVAIFSSRGPNAASSYVLKPDVIAPGVDILAAWPDNVSPSELPEDLRRSEFNIVSGTSMSCPHVSGMAALLKGAHPDWSPAMIRSALMTTAYTVDGAGKPLLDEKDYNASSVWGTGAGHVDPEKAADPGLVYDLSVNDYLDFLCASNYSIADIQQITSNKSVSCTGKKFTPWELNYPAITVAVDMSSGLPKFEVAVTRTVTQVSDGASSYSVMVTPPRGVNATVDPPKMEFKGKGEKKSYVVRISAENKAPGELVTESGKLTWTDGKHRVTSPIVVVWQYGSV